MKQKKKYFRTKCQNSKELKLDNYMYPKIYLKLPFDKENVMNKNREKSQFKLYNGLNSQVL